MIDNALICQIEEKIFIASKWITSISYTDSDQHAAHAVRDLAETLKILYELKQKAETLELLYELKQKEGRGRPENEKETTNNIHNEDA